MPRCPECNKFVPIEVENEDADVNINGASVTAEIRLVKKCQECDCELAETVFEFAEEADHVMGDECELEEVDNGIELTDSGGARYKKRMLGYNISIQLLCSCGWTGEVTGEESIAASYFDELV